MHEIADRYSPAQSRRPMWLQEELGRKWCFLMHDSPMWPLHGRYQCRQCGRHYAVPWAADRSVDAPPKAPEVNVGSTMVRSLRSALLPVLTLLLLLQSTPARAAGAAEGFGGIAGEEPSRRSEYTAGRAYYAEGEFKKAAAHFQLALATDPEHADAYYWMGMAYQVLADVSGPSNGKYRAKARFCLSKAQALAPARSEYRRELFNFLLDASGRSSSRQAKNILRSVSESDPDYGWMRARFESETKANSTAPARLGRWVLAGPEEVYRIADLPVSSIRDPKTSRR